MPRPPRESKPQQSPIDGPRRSSGRGSRDGFLIPDTHHPGDAGPCLHRYIRARRLPDPTRHRRQRLHRRDDFVRPDHHDDDQLILRRLALAVPVEAAGQHYSPAMDVDVIGCRVCVALRELLSFAWSSDPARMNRLMDEGGCYPAAPGVAFTRLEYGDDVSLFRMILSPPADPSLMPALWFRDGDMVVDGSNTAQPARSEIPLAGL
jgi:hypothetical protein